jgi:glutaminyl-peptide cyclotransferase
MHACPLVAVALLATACGSDSDDTDATTPSPGSTSTTVAPATSGVETMKVEIVETVPHDAGAFTQGLQFDEEGRLFESTGLEGESTLREVDLETGYVKRSKALDNALFAEGLALVDDQLFQITFRDRTAFVYDQATFEQVATYEYEGEGWGLCYDGEQLIMSNGSNRLTFRDPATFEVTGGVDVTLDGNVLQELNELECIDGGKVYSNLFRSDLIALIDVATGAVETLIDASSLPRPGGADVLNGIAVDPDGGLWLTGKRWDAMYRVDLVPADA